VRRDGAAAGEEPAARCRDEALARLKASYGEALARSPERPYANLDWVLGTEAASGRSPALLEHKMMPVFALWLQDLAAEVDRSLSIEPGAGPAETPPPARAACETLALRLREATMDFPAAHRARASR